MTSIGVLPRFTSRQEGDGFVLLVQDGGRYLYANASAHELLDRLRSGAPVDEVVSAVAARYAWEDDQARLLLAELVDVVNGRLERAGTAADPTPCVRPLADLLGESADRCETFGMPL
ncbi:PqqD family protein [Streptomyces sp. NPDC005727]|uniref:PqqD family protein n=1 Tax=unclassified Streptomyces TaxID=2593676 RepID=UPI0033E5004F